MTNHKGEISTHSNHIRVPMQVLDDSYKIFELGSIKTLDYDITVHTAISGFLKAESQNDHVMILMLVLLHVLIQS